MTDLVSDAVGRWAWPADCWRVGCARADAVARRHADGRPEQ